MVDRAMSLREAWDVFKGESIWGQLYLIGFVLILASGSTFLKPFALYIFVVTIGCLFVSALDRKRGDRQPTALLVRALPASCILLALIALFMASQISYAFVPSIVQTYTVRYLLFATMALFVVRPDLLAACIRFGIAYLNLCAVSIIVMTLLAGHKTGGLLGDFQSGGMMMSIACVLNLIDYYREGGKAKSLLLVILCMVALLFTGKRTFALIALGAIFVVYLFAASKRKPGFKFLVAVVIILAALILAYTYIDAARTVFERFLLLASDDEFDAMSGRNLLWDAAWQTFLEYPMTGIGFGGFEKWYATYYSGNRGTAYLTHNIYYGMLSETGVIGTALFILLFISGLVFTVRQIVSVRRGVHEALPYAEYVLVVSLALQLWFVVYGVTGNGTYDVAESVLYVAALCMAYSCSAKGFLASCAPKASLRGARCR